MRTTFYRGLCCVVGAVLLIAEDGSALARSIGFDASLPRAVLKEGFTNETFSIISFSRRTVDTRSTYRRSFKLYNFNFFYSRQPASLTTLKHDGSAVTGSAAYNGSLTTAACVTPACKDFVGVAFGGGGYFEAEISYDASRIDLKDGWPAFWALPIESTLNLPGYHWNGQPADYKHAAELDILEQNQNRLDAYGATLHDWYGIRNVSCPNFCGFHAVGSVRVVGIKNDWKEFHSVGALWVAATQSSNGYLQFFYDRRPIGARVMWAEYKGVDEEPPPSEKTPWSFGVIDRQHMVLIIGSGRRAPIRVRAIRVWQESAASNLSR